MKILHTADWHIGQSFFGYDRKGEHIYFLDWLKKTIQEQQADVLLVAGDVFDTPNPSAESQKIYYRFLREITTAHPQLQIIITAGNHDSAARLEAPNPLLEGMNVHIRGIVSGNPEGSINPLSLCIPLIKAEQTKAWCIAVPYLRQGDYPTSNSYAKGVKGMYDLLYDTIRRIKTDGQFVVFMGHLQATGSEISESDRSERTIIGGLESVSPEIFDRKDVVYTALGHLHKAQRVSGRDNVRYAGSPLPMSFAEKNYKQGINLVEIGDAGLAKIERIDFEPPVQLISLPKEPQPLDRVLEEIAHLPAGAGQPDAPFLELKVLLTEPEPAMRSRIEEALKNKSVRLTAAVPFRVGNPQRSASITYEELKALTPMEMAQDMFRSRYGNEMPDYMQRLLQTVIREAGR